MINVLVTGASGQLGSELKEIQDRYSNYSFCFTDRKELDITNYQRIFDFVNKRRVDVIINCAAFTAVDKAEMNTELADKINNIGAKNLAKISKDYGIKLVHISTDYVFDGLKRSPYLESDQVNPLNVYGTTKLKGEESIIDINPPNSIIVRTSWLYSSYGENFVKTMLRLGTERKTLKVINDQFGTPTYARDLALMILDIVPNIRHDSSQIFHYSNEGESSWYDFARSIFEIKKIDLELLPVDSSEYQTMAERPTYSVLSKKKIKNYYSVDIPIWQDSLSRCLARI